MITNSHYGRYCGKPQPNECPSCACVIYIIRRYGAEPIHCCAFITHIEIVNDAGWSRASPAVIAADRLCHPSVTKASLRRAASSAAGSPRRRAPRPMRPAPRRARASGSIRRSLPTLLRQTEGGLGGAIAMLDRVGACRHGQADRGVGAGPAGVGLACAGPDAVRRGQQAARFKRVDGTCSAWRPQASCEHAIMAEPAALAYGMLAAIFTDRGTHGAD
jgi:hypothetical protein